MMASQRWGGHSVVRDILALANILGAELAGVDLLDPDAFLPTNFSTDAPVACRACATFESR